MNYRYVAAIAVSSLCAFAWQDSLAGLKLTRETFDRSITNYVREAAGSDHLRPYVPGMGRIATQALMAMSDGARSAAVKELGLAAKAVVMSPAFATAYEEYIKNSHNAVNHGIVVKDKQATMMKAAQSGDMAAYQQEAGNMMRNAFRQQVAERAKEFDKMERAQIELLADTEAGVIEMMVQPKTAAEKANVAKAKAMLGEAKKLAASDIQKARSTYRAGMMLAAGLSDESQAANAVEDRKKQEQQENYNRLLLKPMLKKQLLEFVALAKTVDFKAATQQKGDKVVFVNPAHERKDGMWKTLFRLGPGGTNAAISVAQSWAAEL